MTEQLEQLIEQAKKLQADGHPAPWPFRDGTDYWAGVADGLDAARDLLLGKEVPTLPWRQETVA